MQCQLQGSQIACCMAVRLTDAMAAGTREPLRTVQRGKLCTSSGAAIMQGL